MLGSRWARGRPAAPMGWWQAPAEIAREAGERLHAYLEGALLHRAHRLLEVGHLPRLHDGGVDVLRHPGWGGNGAGDEWGNGTVRGGTPWGGPHHVGCAGSGWVCGMGRGGNQPWMSHIGAEPGGGSRAVEELAQLARGSSLLSELLEPR